MKKLLITCILLLSIPTLVLADPTESDLNNAQNQIAQYQNEKNDAQTKRDDLNSQIEKLDTEATELTLQQENVQSQIDSKQIEINNTKDELDKALAQLKDSEDKFNNYARSVYENGQEDVLEVLFSAKSFSDLIDRAEASQIIGDFRHNTINSFKKNKQSVEDKTNELNKEQNNLVNLKAQLEQGINNLNDSKQKITVLLSQQQDLMKSIDDKLQVSQQEYNDILNSLAAQAAAAKAAQESQVNSNSNLSTDNNVVSNGNGTSIDVANYALTFLGLPYIWGGTTPNPGFDCSGFMQYVYRHFGYNISRTTYTQIYDGIEVPKDKLQVGDLIFFGDYNAPHHVAMYIGNGYYVHAPETGDVIKISKLNPNSTEFCRARRIIQ